MKLCLITNYLNKGYIDETLILKQLCKTLSLSPKDIVDFSNENVVYDINNQYTHALVLLDYNITSHNYIKHFLSELKIPKIFIIDSIPEIEKNLNKQFVDNYSAFKDYHFSTLKINEWNQVYSLADGIIFYNEIDYQEFLKYYKPNQVPFTLIPPSLGEKKDIIFNHTNVIKNKNIGFNGTPSYSTGIFHYGFFNNLQPDYNFSIYGSHGKNPQKNESVLNHVIKECSNVNFYGKLKDYRKFYLNNFIYYDFNIYNSFSYSMYQSLINGVIPIISKNTSSSLYLVNYPFQTEYMDVNSLSNQIQLIQNTSVSGLIDIMEGFVDSLSFFNNENCKELYYEFIKDNF